MPTGGAQCQLLTGKFRLAGKWFILDDDDDDDAGSTSWDRLLEPLGGGRVPLHCSRACVTEKDRRAVRRRTPKP